MAKKKTAAEAPSAAEAAPAFVCKGCKREQEPSADPRGGLPTSWTKDDAGDFRCFPCSCRMMKVPKGGTMMWAVPDSELERYVADGWRAATARERNEYATGVAGAPSVGRFARDHTVIVRAAA